MEVIPPLYSNMPTVCATVSHTTLCKRHTPLRAARPGALPAGPHCGGRGVVLLDRHRRWAVPGRPDKAEPRAGLLEATARRWRVPRPPAARLRSNPHRAGRRQLLAAGHCRGPHPRRLPGHQPWGAVRGAACWAAPVHCPDGLHPRLRGEGRRHVRRHRAGAGRNGAAAAGVERARCQ